MIVSLMVAMDEEQGIGKDNQLPWHLPGDLKNFKKITMGHHLILGRKTFESIGRALPGRTMLVLTSAPQEPQENLRFFSSISEATQFAREAGEEEVFIIGGANIYHQTLELADRIYLTQVQTIVDADAFFPKLDRSLWISTEKVLHTEDKYQWSFEILNRVS